MFDSPALQGLSTLSNVSSFANQTMSQAQGLVGQYQVRKQVENQLVGSGLAKDQAQSVSMAMVQQAQAQGLMPTPGGMPMMGGFPPQMGGIPMQMGGMPMMGGMPPQMGGFPPQMGGMPMMGGVPGANPPLGQNPMVAFLLQALTQITEQLKSMGVSPQTTLPQEQPALGSTATEKAAPTETPTGAEAAPAGVKKEYAADFKADTEQKAEADMQGGKSRGHGKAKGHGKDKSHGKAKGHD